MTHLFAVGTGRTARGFFGNFSESTGAPERLQGIAGDGSCEGLKVKSAEPPERQTAVVEATAGYLTRRISAGEGPVQHLFGWAMEPRDDNAHVLQPSKNLICW
eukprot:s619_g36.t1